MITSFEERKAALLEQLVTIDGARRGQLSEQYYSRQTADGRTVRQGPYYVWQRYVNGKKCSVRIPPEQIERVEQEIENGRQVQELLDELWEVLEQTAIEEDHDAKKKPKRSKRRTSARPMPPSS
jgi:hypothetical protein